MHRSNNDRTDHDTAARSTSVPNRRPVSEETFASERFEPEPRPALFACKAVPTYSDIVTLIGEYQTPAVLRFKGKHVLGDLFVVPDGGLEATASPARQAAAETAQLSVVAPSLRHAHVQEALQLYYAETPSVRPKLRRCSTAFRPLRSSPM